MAQDELNAIACENCRSKKCKCDRKLPSCSQCQSSAIICRYQEGGKRGLPAAYIASLEKRLQETEIALCAALFALPNQTTVNLEGYRLVGSTSVSLGRERSKAYKQDEWKRLPLQTNEDLAAWLRAKYQENTSSEAERADFRRPGFGVNARRKQEVGRLGEGIAMTSSEPFSSAEHVQAHPEFSPTSKEPAIEQLQSCIPPTTPNTTQVPLQSIRWHANYF